MASRRFSTTRVRAFVAPLGELKRKPPFRVFAYCPMSVVYIRFAIYPYAKLLLSVPAISYCFFN